MEAHYLSHKLARYYRCNLCCDLCLAVKGKNNAVMSIGNLTMDSAWRRTIHYVEPSEPSPWMQVPGFTDKKCRLLDLLHIVHLGILRDIIAGCLCDALDDGTLAHFYGLQGQPADLVLYRMSQHAHSWAKDQGLDLYIGTLTCQRLGRTHKGWPYPVLDSRIKAGRCRTLFGFVTWLMVRLATYTVQTQEQRTNAKVRAVCCWTLDTAISLFNTNKKLKMKPWVVQQTTWLCRLHSATYQWLSARCLSQRRLLYKIRPKTHYFTHMIDHHQETGLCLLHLSTFGDEDFMGKVRQICQACHGSTYMQSWAKRYLLKRAAQWSEMKKCAVGPSMVHVMTACFAFWCWYGACMCVDEVKCHDYISENRECEIFQFSSVYTCHGRGIVMMHDVSCMFYVWRVFFFFNPLKLRWVIFNNPGCLFSTKKRPWVFIVNKETPLGVYFCRETPLGFYFCKETPPGFYFSKETPLGVYFCLGCKRYAQTPNWHVQAEYSASLAASDSEANPSM